MYLSLLGDLTNHCSAVSENEHTCRTFHHPPTHAEFKSLSGYHCHVQSHEGRQSPFISTNTWEWTCYVLLCFACWHSKEKLSGGQSSNHTSERGVQLKGVTTLTEVRNIDLLCFVNLFTLLLWEGWETALQWKRSMKAVFYQYRVLTLHSCFFDVNLESVLWGL